jgi:hypothetical protein
MSRTCAEVHRIARGLKRFRFPFDEELIPLNGVYLLFEQGEEAHGGDRIVRIGTHRGQGNLRSRLREHFIKENKDRSIFRRNVGRAILNKANDQLLKQWNLDLTKTAARDKHGATMDRGRIAEVERLVSRHIQEHCTFVVIAVDHKEHRHRLESRLISTVSLCEEHRPSSNWLGLSSPLEKIRQSGLWLVNELWKTPLSDDDLKELERLAQARPNT